MHPLFSLHLGVVLLAGCLHASMIGCRIQPVAKTVYLQSNENQNSLISIPIGNDGMLYGGMTSLTGGNGSDSINGMTHKPASPDALSSQGSVLAVDNLVFVVNAGSNTLSLFKVDRNDPSSVVLVGEPAKIPGQFPVTVAASIDRKMACVGYTGAKAGVACAGFTISGLQRMNQVLHFDLHQATPPVGPTNTIAQVFFTGDDTRLITTVKGDPSINSTGFISVLPFKKSCLSEFESNDIRSSPAGTAVLFGGLEIPDTSEFFITDASFGATLLSLDNSTDKIILQQKLEIKNQQATCWAAYSRAKRSVYVTDAALNRLIEVSSDGSKVLEVVDLKNGDPGLTDLQVAGRFVYALSPGNGTTNAAITVVDSFQGQQIQHFELNHLGASKRSQGLAVL